MRIVKTCHRIICHASEKHIQNVVYYLIILNFDNIRFVRITQIIFTSSEVFLDRTRLNMFVIIRVSLYMPQVNITRES